MAQSLEDKVLSFLKVWQSKVGQSGLDAINNALNYSNQQTDLQPDFKVQVFGNGGVRWALTFKTPDGRSYWQFIERGVDGWDKGYGSPYKFKKGGLVPPKALASFIEKRNLKLDVDKSIKGKSRSLAYDKQKKTLAFKLGYSIKKKGIKPKPFVKDIMTDELMTELKVGMAKIFGEEIIATFRQAD